MRGERSYLGLWKLEDRDRQVSNLDLNL